MRTSACASAMFDGLLGNTIIFIVIYRNNIAHHRMAKTRSSQQRGREIFILTMHYPPDVVAVSLAFAYAL